ncbi:MAG: tRNA pseudouridine(55) synthase TruB [Gammaproteobacteria bacterium]|jgi:tRNA pseudouridine55 synthase|nr:tRNA pseudouridine(55) synthase TruB [Gammaproteobacteria bacterium]
MSKKPRGRAINGILLLDKPVNWSSNDALQKVKRIYQAAKAGHTGSLDPLASGMLPICLGEATKISAYLLDADKTYVFKCALGKKTTTADAEGEVIQTRPHEHITRADVERLLPQFTGDLMQVPPMYSALKKDGKRLYELAREGIEVEREPRPVTIYKLELLSFTTGEMELLATCSKGTYVRTLAEDMGEVLGCGAYITALRRTSVGPYAGKEMITLEQLQAMAEQGTDHLDAQLMPLDTGLMNWPAVELDANSAFYIKQGQPVLVAKSPVSGLVRIYDQSRFLGVGEIQDDGKVAPRRLMHV